MVVLRMKDSAGSPWCATLIDGYLSDDRIRALYSESVHEEPLLAAEPLLCELVDHLRAEFERARAKGETRFRPALFCDMYLLGLAAPNLLGEYAPLRTEQAADARGADYRHILVVHQGCPHEDHCTRDLMERLGIELKGEAEYVAPSVFAHGCEALMEDILPVYVSPSLAGQVKLDSLGFTYHCGGR